MKRVIANVAFALSLAFAGCVLSWCLAMLVSQQAHAQDASSAWNAVAGNYNFLTTSQALSGSTFEQAYTGSRFADDFAGIKSAVSSVCGSPIMDPDGDETMHSHLANWN